MRKDTGEVKEGGADKSTEAVAGYAAEVKRSALGAQGAPNPNTQANLGGIASLAHAPRPAGCKKLKGYKDLWRIRSGDYRVIYSIGDEVRVVEVRRVANRTDAKERRR